MLMECGSPHGLYGRYVSIHRSKGAITICEVAIFSNTFVKVASTYERGFGSHDYTYLDAIYGFDLTMRWPSIQGINTNMWRQQTHPEADRVTIPEKFRRTSDITTIMEVGMVLRRDLWRTGPNSQ